MRVVCTAFAATIAVWASPSLGADALTIADIAPKKSALVVGVDDFAAMKAAFDRTGMRNILDDPSVKEWFKKTTEEATDKLTEMLETIDAKMEDLSLPTGAAGFALWMQEQKEPTDPPFGFIAMGDFGDGADSMHDTLLAAFEKGEEKNELTMKREDFGKTEIFTLTQVTPEEAGDVDEADADDEDAEEWEDWEGWEDEDASPIPTIETMYYARVGSRLVASSVLADLENAIDRIGGKALTSVRENEDFHAARAQVGTHDGYVVLLTSPLYEAAAAKAQKAEEEGTPGSGMLAWLDALGVVEVHAASMGLRFDTDDGMMETKYAVLAPRLRGLLSLFDVQPSSFEPPAFVSADAATYTMMQVKLADVMNVLQEVVQGLPAEEAQQAAIMVPMIQGFAGPILGAMGSEIYISQSYARPYAADSQKTLIAISVTNAEALSAAMDQSATQVGLVSRDFQGSQVWSLPPGTPMGEVAIAVGFGAMFIGPEGVVENALRLAAQGGKDAVTLANDESFQRAQRAVAPKGYSFSYTNLRRTIDYAKWFVSNYDNVMKAQMAQMLGDIDDPEIRKMVEENQPEKPQWLADLPNLEIIAKHMGDSVSEFQRSDDGMRGRTVWLRPAK